jgi:hypothetical protein
MNLLAQLFVSITLVIQTLIGGFFPSQQTSQQIPSVQQATTNQPISPAEMYSAADLERFRTSGAAKQCSEPRPGAVPTRIYIGDYKYAQIEEDLATSSVSDEYVSVQDYVIYDGTQTFTWYIDPGTKMVGEVTRSMGTVPFFDTPKDVTCVDWNIDESAFALPPGVKIIDSPDMTNSNQQQLEQERQSIQYAKAILNSVVTKQPISFAQKVQASSRTDIPDLDAFVNKWGSTIDSMDSEANILNNTSIETLSPTELNALSTSANKLLAGQINILAAYNNLPRDQLLLLNSTPSTR